MSLGKDFDKQENGSELNCVLAYSPLKNCNNNLLGKWVKREVQFVLVVYGAELNAVNCYRLYTIQVTTASYGH